MNAVEKPVRRGNAPSGPASVCGRASHPTSASDYRIIERVAPADLPVEEELGHWRNRWNVPEKHSQLAKRQGALPLGDGTWLGYRRFPTSNAAEHEAKRVSEYNFLMFGISYIGPEFFPDY